MPSSKLSSRRGVAARPHVCHPPPPPALPLPPPAGDYALDPTHQVCDPWNTARVEVTATNTTYPPEAYFPITWQYLWGSLEEPGAVANGGMEPVWWNPEGSEGNVTLICTFWDPTHTLVLAVREATVHVEEGPA